MRNVSKRWYAAALTVPTVVGIGIARSASADSTLPDVSAGGSWPSAGGQTSGGSGPTAPGYPFSGLWTKDISSASLDSDQAPAADLARQVAGAFGGVAAVNSDSYNIPIYKVNNSTPKKTVNWNDCQGKGYTPPEVTSPDGPFASVPMPDDAKGSNGTDASVAFYNTDTGDLWELWGFNGNNGSPSACWGGKMNVHNQTTFPGTTGASATGLPVSAGAISPADVEHAKQTGDFGHAMYLVVRQARQYDTFSWPAKRSDGDAAAPAPVEGTRFRLGSDVNVDAMNLTPFGKMVANTAKKYGFIVSDKGGAVGVSTTVDDAFWNQQFSSTPAYQQLAGFPWDKMQLLPMNYGQGTDGPTGDASGSSSAPTGSTPSSSSSASGSATSTPSGSAGSGTATSAEPSATASSGTATP